MFNDIDYPYIFQQAPTRKNHVDILSDSCLRVCPLALSTISPIAILATASLSACTKI